MRLRKDIARLIKESLLAQYEMARTSPIARGESQGSSRAY